MFNIIGLLTRQQKNIARCASLFTKKRSAKQKPSLNFKTNLYTNLIMSGKRKSPATKINAKSTKKDLTENEKKLDPAPKKAKALKSKLVAKIEELSDTETQNTTNQSRSIKARNSSKKRKRSDSDDESFESSPPKKQKTTKTKSKGATNTTDTPTPIFFDTPADLRVWFEENASTAAELILGMRKKASGLPSVNWYQAVGEALCFGWIDGRANGIDELTYRQRFTPRRPGSIWSAVNIKRVETLIQEGKMTPAGLAAFEKRTEARSKIYSHEQESVEFAPEQEKIFRKEEDAWEFFQKQPAGYKRQMTWWVISAKRPETRESRLKKLMDSSAQLQRLPVFGK